MACATRLGTKVAIAGAHSPYLLLNRICTHSRSVLMSSVSLMKASHFSMGTHGPPLRVLVKAKDS